MSWHSVRVDTSERLNLNFHSLYDMAWTGLAHTQLKKIWIYLLNQNFLFRCPTDLLNHQTKSIYLNLVPYQSFGNGCLYAKQGIRQERSCINVLSVPWTKNHFPLIKESVLKLITLKLTGTLWFWIWKNTSFAKNLSFNGQTTTIC